MNIPKYLILASDRNRNNTLITWPIYLYSLKEVHKRLLSLALAGKRVLSVHRLEVKKLKNVA